MLFEDCLNANLLKWLDATCPSVDQSNEKSTAIMDTSFRSSDEYSRTVAAIGAAVGSGDLRRAYELANWAIGQGMEGRVIYNARALAYQASGRYDEAVIDFRRALKFSPNDAGIYAAIGASLSAQNLYQEAIHAYEKTISLAPNVAMTHFRRAAVFAQIHEYEPAETDYARAIELDPGFAAAMAEYASLAARRGEYERAKELSERALEISPGNPIAHYAMALVEMNKRQYAETEQRLRFLIFHKDLDAVTRGGMCSLLGDALEGQKRYTEAFEAYLRGNQFLREEKAAQFKDARGREAIQHITAYFEKTSAAKWKPALPVEHRADGPSQHVFLLGFMRSGTTLLEQVLASHPGIVALEEKYTLNHLSERYMRSNEELDELADIHGSALSTARAGYWERVHKSAPDIGGKVLVDKQPLNTTRLPLIAKLFPDAKVLFALRDPRDVVFSCYRRPFNVNTTMFEFLDLEDAARMYASIMNLATLYREKLTLNLMEHYYEDMISDFENRVRAVCEFIGIEWSDSMRDFNKRAPQININSPSAKQVRRPLYGEGIGQWRRYAEQLQPMMPILRPWVEKFGYSVE